MSWFLVSFLTTLPFFVIVGIYRSIGKYEGQTGKEVPFWIFLVVGVILYMLVIQYVPWMLPDEIPTNRSML